MWCDLGKPVTCRKRWNCKIKEINIVILMFLFIFYSLWTIITFDTSIRGDKGFGKIIIQTFTWYQYYKISICTMWRVFSYHITYSVALDLKCMMKLKRSDLWLLKYFKLDLIDNSFELLRLGILTICQFGPVVYCLHLFSFSSM